MPAEQAKNETEPSNDAAEVGRKNETSTIAFPYGDLDSAILVVRKVHENAGTTCTLPQLAAYLNMQASAGGFRARIAPARVFGLAEIDRGTITLTDLGRQIVDPLAEKGAKVTAFLYVELYKAVFDKFNGTTLPQSKALEQEMQRMGVAPKQADKARQVFERSAQQAGFFNHGKDRLVMPAVSQRAGEASSQKQEEQRSSRGAGNGGGGDGSNLDPIIKALVEKIPSPADEAAWAVAEQVKWLQMMAMAFGMIYKNDTPITVKEGA